MNETIFVTGAAGFIGFHLCIELLKKNLRIVALDNINSYYDINLKKDRLEEIKLCEKNTKGSFFFIKGDLEDKPLINKIFAEYKPKIVIHLAAQAGVRYSLKNPEAYIQSNIVGFINILEGCREYKLEHLLYASSSSVYGGNTKTPFSETDSVEHPVSLYAATKRSNELIAHSYSHLFNIPSTGMRFFTVYGPWGRPDMAPMLFTKAISKGKPIKIFNNGQMSRDFTYVGDIVEAIFKLIKIPPKVSKEFNRSNPDRSKSWAAHRILNIGNSCPINLMEFINIIEKELRIEAIKSFEPMQPGDVEKTYADTIELEKLINYHPKTKLEEGIKKFIKWYQEYYAEY